MKKIYILIFMCLMATMAKAHEYKNIYFFHFVCFIGILSVKGHDDSEA